MNDPCTALLQDIEEGKVALVYHLSGESHPIERVVSALRRAVLKGEENAFNTDVLIAGEASASSILAAARTLPMFGPRRWVLVREAHALSAADLGRLLPYIKDPCPSTCLLFLAEKVDLRLKFFLELKKHGVAMRFEPLKERQAPAWIAAQAREMKIKLLPGAAERIAEAVGTDMAQLASALERLSLYVGSGKAVGPADADEVLAQTRQRSIFELTNAVGRGQRREALLVLGKMLQDKEPPVRIVTMLARHLRQLWSLTELARQGQGKGELAASLGIHPYFLQEMQEQARRFGEPALQRTHQALFLADRRLKSSRLPEALVLEELVLRLCPKERLP